MSNDSYDLLGLCDAADVTPRTVRYYVQQGLLPSPDTRGRGARYDRAHLERVQLIKLLQARHLPLAEIRTQLAGLSDAAVSALVAEPAEKKSASALSYVQRVLTETKQRNDTQGDRILNSVPPPVPTWPSLPKAAPSPHVSPTDALPEPAPSASPPTTTAAEALPPQPSTQSRSTWDRIPLAPDIELHIRRPLSRVQNKLLERLLEHARALFSDPS